MIKRVYIDNYKCLVRFEWKPASAPVSLLLGPNGSGKSTVFEVLSSVQQLVSGRNRIEKLFPPSSRSFLSDIWDQTIELDWEGAGRVHSYKLVIRHEPDGSRTRIEHEGITVNGMVLYTFDGGAARIAEGYGIAGERLSFERFQSPLAVIERSRRRPQLYWILESLDRMLILQANPPMMNDISTAEERWADRHFENFVSWYRWLSQDQGIVSRLQTTLGDVLEGFSGLKFEQFGPEARQLRLSLADARQKPYSVAFSSLSDGQRMLIALYALLEAAASPVRWDIDEPPPQTLLCLDEPDNFLNSREIQPWMLAAADVLENAGSNAFIISHHPEIINLSLMPDNGCETSVFWFERENGGPTSVKPISRAKDSGVSPSELAARGWLGA